MNVVNDSVTKISDYIKGKNLKDFKLVITPGESQVPNPKGFEQKGSLAMKRAEVLKKYLETNSKKTNTFIFDTITLFLHFKLKTFGSFRIFWRIAYRNNTRNYRRRRFYINGSNFGLYSKL